MKSAFSSIHLWIPDYQSAKGGIQVFSNHLVRALEKILPESRISIFSKNDTSFPPLPKRTCPTAFHANGWWPGRLRTLAFSARIAQKAIAERPGLIISTHPNFTPIAHQLKRLIGTRYLSIAHGVDVWGVRRGLMVDALRAADGVLAVSRFTRSQMIADMHLAPEQVCVLANTFDSAEFLPEPKPHYLLKRYNLSKDTRVILTVARLASAERYKGYDQILQALPAIRKAIPDVCYMLGGRGPDRPRIEAMIRNLHLEDVVKMVGYIPDHELNDYYNLCDLFAMPSKGEGFGIVFLEALACGKPVLAGNKDGSMDALLGGELGVLIDPDNLHDLTQAMVAALMRRHPLKILQDSVTLRKRVIEAYGFDSFTKSVSGHLAHLLPEKP
ncbi:MAG: glycosyltransferase [Verrucomicrobiota bacterium]